MTGKTMRDHALAIVKAGVSAIPFLGGPLGSLIEDYIPTSTSRSVEHSLRTLANRLAVLNNRIDVEAVDKEEFAELFKSAYLVMMRAHKAERRRAAVNLVANILLKPDDPERLSYTELDHFARALDTLSIGALRCAAAIYRDTLNLSTAQAGSARHLNFEDIAGQFPDYEADLLMGLLGELNAQNIIHLPGAPGIRTTAYGNYPIERTALGCRFVARLLVEGNDDA